MENPFKKIDKPIKPVPELKAKVMNDIATAKLLMELSGLFSLNLGKVIEETMKKRKNNK